jgi:transposase
MELYRQNMSIDEIAKSANLGKGEVELFLRLTKVLH